MNQIFSVPEPFQVPDGTFFALPEFQGLYERFAVQFTGWRQSLDGYYQRAYPIENPCYAACDPDHVCGVNTKSLITT